MPVFGLILGVSGHFFFRFLSGYDPKYYCLALQLQKAHRCRSFNTVFSFKDPYLTEKSAFLGRKSLFWPFLTEKKELFVDSKTRSKTAKTSPNASICLVQWLCMLCSQFGCWFGGIRAYNLPEVTISQVLGKGDRESHNGL